MNRIENRFSLLKLKSKKALIPFITVGDPDGVDTHLLMKALVDGGADLIELGVPFSDPAADGPVIQKASERSLLKNTSFKDILNEVRAFRKNDSDTPIIAMGYLNTAESYLNGFEDYVNDSIDAGIDGIILVDLSYESGKEYRSILDGKNLDLIQLIAPTTKVNRLKSIVKKASGFVYYISMRGTTGSKINVDNDETLQLIDKIKQQTDLPICVGFGINNGEDAKNMAKYADGIVIGSALVKKIYDASQEQKDVCTVATDFVASLRSSLDND